MSSNRVDTQAYATVRYKRRELSYIERKSLGVLLVVSGERKTNLIKSETQRTPILMGATIETIITISTDTMMIENGKTKITVTTSKTITNTKITTTARMKNRTTTTTRSRDVSQCQCNILPP